MPTVSFLWRAFTCRSCTLFLLPLGWLDESRNIMSHDDPVRLFPAVNGPTSRPPVPAQGVPTVKAAYGAALRACAKGADWERGTQLLDNYLEARERRLRRLRPLLLLASFGCGFDSRRCIASFCACFFFLFFSPMSPPPPHTHTPDVHRR